MFCLDLSPVECVCAVLVFLLHAALSGVSFQACFIFRALWRFLSFQCVDFAFVLLFIFPRQSGSGKLQGSWIRKGEISGTVPECPNLQSPTCKAGKQPPQSRGRASSSQVCSRWECPFSSPPLLRPSCLSSAFIGPLHLAPLASSM